MTKRLLTMFFILLSIAQATEAAVVVNEVLANEPGGETSLEWFELFNDGTQIVTLDFYAVRVDGGASIELSGSVVVGRYAVVTRNAIRFEEHFGDSSGVWGDGLSEDYLLLETSFTLSNAGGRVDLIRLTSDDTVSTFVWYGNSTDGVSWERVRSSEDSIAQSVASSGSTPGGLNSVTPFPFDLALRNVAPARTENGTEILFTIVNVGDSMVPDANLSLYLLDTLAPDSLGQLLTTESVGQSRPGDTILFLGLYNYSGLYASLVVQLDSDDRLENNRTNFVAPGIEYPPLVLTEILPDPETDLGTEWVEIHNVSDQDINLLDWVLADSVGAKVIASADLWLQPNARMVMVEDLALFTAFYSSFVGAVHMPTGWQTLNNGGDAVILFDPFGILADRFDYDSGCRGNRSISRGESVAHADDWGCSVDLGGTPGEPNVVRFGADGASALTLVVEPRVFSPDGDGVDDLVEISLSPPEATSYTLKLYDQMGRLVRTFEDKAELLSDEPYLWDGRDAGGRLQPIGIYILYFEATGVESQKRTLVIAR